MHLHIQYRTGISTHNVYIYVYIYILYIYAYTQRDRERERERERERDKDRLFGQYALGFERLLSRLGCLSGFLVPLCLGLILASGWAAVDVFGSHRTGYPIYKP